MVALAGVRQALYIFVAVFQSTRVMGNSVADCFVPPFGDWRRHGIGAIMADPGQPQRTMEHPRENSASRSGRNLNALPPVGSPL
jgi:hypothetical protein